MTIIFLVFLSNVFTDSARLLLRLACWLGNHDFDELDERAGGSVRKRR